MIPETKTAQLNTDSSDLNRTMLRDRKAFLDLLRIIATCAVVMLHTITGIKDTTDMSPYPTQFKVFLIIMDLTTWCVPIFIMISGFLFLNPDKKLSYGQIICKYCRRILLALLIFGVPYSCLELIIAEHSFRPGMIVEGFVMVCRGQSWSHMWYLYLVLFLYIITPPLKWILAHIPTRTIYVLLAFIFVFGSIFPFVKKWFELENMIALPDEAIYIFYYLYGYLFSVTEQKSSSSIKIPCVLTLLLVTVMAAIRLTVKDSVQLPYNYPFTVPFSLLIFYIAMKTENLWKKHSFTLSKLGALCFTIYLIHPVFINIVYKLLHISLLDYPLAFSVPIVFAGVLILSIPTALLIRKLPLMKKYVL